MSNDTNSVCAQQGPLHRARRWNRNRVFFEKRQVLYGSTRPAYPLFVFTINPIEHHPGHNTRGCRLVALRVLTTPKKQLVDCPASHATALVGFAAIGRRLCVELLGALELEGRVPSVACHGVLRPRQL